MNKPVIGINEFEAWFAGFSENIEVVPTKVQWDRLKEVIEDLCPPPKKPFKIQEALTELTMSHYPDQTFLLENPLCQIIKN